MNPEALEGASVRLRGTAAATFNAPLRHILTVAMFVPRREDLIVDWLPGKEIYHQAITPLNAIAQYRRGESRDPRIRVKGAVTAQRPGKDIFLRDASGGLQVTCVETNLFSIGEVVEAIGFPDLDNYLPVLRDAKIVRTGERAGPMEAKEASLEELLNGQHHCEFIRLRGTLLDTSVKRIGKCKKPQELKTVLTLQSGSFVFTAEVPGNRDTAEASAMPVGSVLEVSGVCLLQVGREGKAEAIQLLLPDTRGIRVLQKPSWWTTKRLLTGVGILLAALAVAFAWTIMIMRKNSALKTLIAEKTEAQGELEKANDLLESRVEERTKQLKVEMTARKEAEVQFKATLTERTRLAQELHDTLEQSLTGIGLQLDAANRLFERQAARASHHVEVARNLMALSQKELRRSIWDLRSRELEEFDLRNALLACGRRTINGANIEIQMATEGEIWPLSEVVEENLLRIGQEALTNVVKHAGASNVRIMLTFDPRTVVLRIQDDGKGFELDHAPGGAEGHFGLIGMQERSKRINAFLTVESAPNAGTCVRVEIPADAPLKEETEAEAA